MPELQSYSNWNTDPDDFWRPLGSDPCAPEVCSFVFAARNGEPDAPVLRCRVCDHEVAVADDVVEMVEHAQLDEHKIAELAGNEIELDPDTIRHYLNKESWSSFTQHFSEQKLRRLAKLLIADRVLIPAFLGSGTGFEIAPLIRYGYRPASMLVSDLNRSTLEIAKYNLAAAGLPPGTPVSLFTADLDSVPLKNRERPIVVYECLHHTPDMHLTLERMMSFGYRTIYFVEPTTNWLMKWLARRGLAQRIEYSGVDPDRLDLKRLESMCAQHDYEIDTTTIWEFPEDYYRRILDVVPGRRSPRWLQRIVLASIDLLSLLGRPFDFGNFAICRLQKR